MSDLVSSFYQYYPMESPTHLEKKWGDTRIEIWRLEDGRFVAFSEFYETPDNPTGRISGWWSPGYLQELLAWIDDTYISTGLIPDRFGHPQVQMYFSLQYGSLRHVYAATIEGWTKRFDNWRYQECYDWIDARLEAALPDPTTLTLSVEQREEGETPGPPWFFDLTARLTSDGEKLHAKPIQFYRDNVIFGVPVNTDAYGAARKIGHTQDYQEYEFHAYFAGNSDYAESTSPSVIVAVEEPAPASANIIVRGKATGGFPTPEMRLTIWEGSNQIGERVISNVAIGAVHEVQAVVTGAGVHSVQGRMSLSNALGESTFLTDTEQFELG